MRSSPRAGGWWLARRVRRAVGEPVPGAPLTACELGVSSQNGEDGVLQALFERLGTRSRHFVEFGIGTGEQGNCVLLADSFGWAGLFVEADGDAHVALAAKYRRNPRVVTRHAVITPDNVQAEFQAAGVPRNLDVLSIDIDGNDYWVWQAITAYSPRVVVIEYNANLPLAARLVMPRDDGHAWDRSDYFGASLGALRELGGDKGYQLVHTDSTGVNAFFVRDTEAAAVLPTGGVPEHGANYFGQGLGFAQDRRRRPFLDLGSGDLIDFPRAPEPAPR